MYTVKQVVQRPGDLHVFYSRKQYSSSPDEHVRDETYPKVGPNKAILDQRGVAECDIPPAACPL